MRLTTTSLKQTAFAGALALAYLATVASPAQAQQNSVTPPSGWAPYGPAITMNTSQSGYADKLTCDACVKTQGQTLSTNLNYRVYKNVIPTNDSYDYYLVAGNFSHGVQGTSGKSNWLSYGIYGTDMTLTVHGNGAYVMDYGPTSTSGSYTTGFSVGAGVGAGSGNSASFGWSSSYSTPDTTFASTADANQMIIKTALPGGTNPDGNTLGFTYPGAIVFRVRQGDDFKVTITDGVSWGYLYPRPTQSETYRAWHSGVFQANFTNRSLMQGSSHLCLAVQGKVLRTGQPVVLDLCTGEPNQKWSYTQYGQVKSAIAGKDAFCMDSSRDRVSGGNLVMMPCTSPVYDAVGKLTADVKASQILQLGQVWNFDMAPTTPSQPNKSFWACGVYSNTSMNVTEDPGCSGYPTGRPSNLVLSSIAGVPLGGLGDNLVVTSGDTAVPGAGLYFHVSGAQHHILTSAIEALNPVDARLAALMGPAFENSFFTIR